MPTTATQAGIQEGNCATEKTVHVFIEFCGQREVNKRSYGSVNISLLSFIQRHQNTSE